MANDKREQAKLVDEVNENTMDGDTPLEKWLNAYLTSIFIVKSAVPADECLSEAKTIIKQIATAEGIPQADGWVDVADRFPSESGYYLVAVNGVVWVAFCAKRDDGGFCWIDVNPDNNKDGLDVEAWQTLPQPYQHKSEEDSK